MKYAQLSNFLLKFVLSVKQNISETYEMEKTKPEDS
jgi:hypothetical protein